MVAESRKKCAYAAGAAAAGVALAGAGAGGAVARSCTVSI